MPADIKQEALEQVERMMASVAGGPGYYGRLYATIAAALLEARAEEAGYLAFESREDELRRAAQEIREQSGGRV